jgi:transcriptional regulator with XRE-family HTH domain
MIREQLANKLKYFREQAEMTIYEVGEKVGKSGKTISAWEKGRGQPDADMLLTLCHLYKIDSIAKLYGETSPSPAVLSSSELTLIQTFRKLNEEGQEKVIAYVYDLERIGQYKKNSQPVDMALDA